MGDPARGADAKAALDGVLVAAPPLHFPLPSPPTGVQLRCLFGQGWRTLRRWGEVYRALLAIHPQEAHWYLSVVGVAPDRQARGCGSALVAALTERCDADGAPAYLECDDRANLAFYERSGFRVVQQTRVLDVPVWCMWRDPK